METRARVGDEPPARRRAVGRLELQPVLGEHRRRRERSSPVAEPLEQAPLARWRRHVVETAAERPLAAEVAPHRLAGARLGPRRLWSSPRRRRAGEEGLDGFWLRVGPSFVQLGDLIVGRLVEGVSKSFERRRQRGLVVFTSS